MGASSPTLDDDGRVAEPGTGHLIDEFPRHESDDWFAMFLAGIELCELFLHASPRLAEYGEGLGVRIFLKETVELCEIQPDDRVAADTDTSRLANPVLSEQIRDLASHTAASGSHSNGPSRETSTGIVGASAQSADPGNAR